VTASRFRDPGDRLDALAGVLLVARGARLAGA
jgi:hypothetical protein